MEKLNRLTLPSISKKELAYLLNELIYQETLEPSIKLLDENFAWLKVTLTAQKNYVVHASVSKV